MIGRTLSHFEVLEKLGEGGMGVVYKARDTQLNRFVALKVLPPGKTADPERRCRFIQEARAASSLSHPHIITIYEIAQAEGVDFIAMEFVAGRTLGQLVPRNGMRPSEALRIAVQIADGLARAHAAGIVHRDLKPSNVMVGESGAKILDFGLAKLTETASQGPEDATLTLARLADARQTDDGIVVGTVAYMSPEQAEGKLVDARTDIFSFGALLYEMLSGQRAFNGTSKQAILAAVIRDEPPLVPQIAHELEKLIVRCLRKDVARRAQHMSDLKIELEQLKEESESGLSGIHAPAAPTPAKRLWIVSAVAGVVLLAAIGVFWSVRSGRSLSTPEMKTVVLTSYPGEQRDPALSPDGKQVAFSWNGDKEDNFDIYVKLVDAGTPVRVTQNPAADIRPVWSPDGRFLAFVRLSTLSNGQGGYYVTPALGGQERKVADILLAPSLRPWPSADWTPDSKSLVIVDTSVNPPSLAQVSVADGVKKPLTRAPANSLGDYLPAVSPDGHWLAFDRVAGVGVNDWNVVPLAEAPSSRPLHVAGESKGNYPGLRCSWTADSRQLVITEGGYDTGRLLRVTVPQPGKAEPILAAGTGAAMPSIARQSGRLAYVHSFLDSNLWRADLRNPKAPAVRWIASPRTEFQPDYSPDGTKIVFISGRSGTSEVWTADADGSHPVQITTQGARPNAPKWSPDGRLIAFAQRPAGNVDIYVVDAQGGAPRRLTTDPADDASASWSRDGKWIYFTSNRTQHQEVWKMPADGSAREVQITQNGGWRSRESFDGKTLYVQKIDLPGLFRIPIGGGPEEWVANVPPLQDWQLVPGAIYYMQPSGEDFRIERVDLNTGLTTEALKLPAGTQGGSAKFTVSLDGRWLVFVHVDHAVSELMMIENFR
jgi:Tol biopolymer transport system component/predicted Ser/Thr protein kinase